LSVVSFGKTFHITGWKVGYCLAPKSLPKSLEKSINLSHSVHLRHSNMPWQITFKILRLINPFLNSIRKRRDLFCEGLETTDFTFTPAQGSFFQLVSYKHLSNEPDLILAKRLTTDYGVALYSDLSVFPR